MTGRGFGLATAHPISRQAVALIEHNTAVRVTEDSGAVLHQCSSLVCTRTELVYRQASWTQCRDRVTIIPGMTHNIEALAFPMQHHL